MKIAVYNQKGEKTGDMQLSDAFDVEVSPKAITLYINYLRAALRSPIANTKDRGAVSGGGRKPWKQKGTGNARAGSTRSPLWIGGGVTFGPSSARNFTKRINSKEKKRVILGIIGQIFRDKKAMVIENLTVSKPSTKDAFQILENLKSEGKISVLYSATDENASLSFRNLSGVKQMKSTHLDIINLISSNNVIASKKALEEIESVFTPKTKEDETKDE